MKTKIAIFIASILVMGCIKPCGCKPPPTTHFYFFYKSSSNPDLLNPQTGIYNPSNVKVAEVIEINGKVNQTEVTGIGGLYPSVNVSSKNTYFIDYWSSAPQNKNNLKMTLIQLNSSDTDTLTYEFNDPAINSPTQVFYNKKPIWKKNDPFEITILK
jgi:hypothetical protein